jgi:peptidoglycan/xylan/chitin deacetylase (PgdA/CDA1 family)
MNKAAKPFPILLYHAIDPGGMHLEKYAVGQTEFEKQLEALRRNDFATYTLDRFFGNEERNLEAHQMRKRIVLSFDDGSLSDYTISLPILLRFEFKALFFVTTGRIGTPGYMNWEQLKELADQGMCVQSHGVSHSFLSEMKDEQMIRELFESKDLLERRLRIRVDFLSLPGGFGSPRVMEAAQKIGFRGVCTSAPGLNPIPSGEERFRVFKRFLISRQTSEQSFQGIVEGKMRKILASSGKDGFKTLAKKMIGPQRYYRLWAKYFKYLPKT